MENRGSISDPPVPRLCLTHRQRDGIKTHQSRLRQPVRKGCCLFPPSILSSVGNNSDRSFSRRICENSALKSQRSSQPGAVANSTWNLAVKLPRSRLMLQHCGITLMNFIVFRVQTECLQTSAACLGRLESPNTSFA